jgi:hypothetical protein
VARSQDFHILTNATSVNAWPGTHDLKVGFEANLRRH